MGGGGGTAALGRVDGSSAEHLHNRQFRPTFSAMVCVDVCWLPTAGSKSQE